MNKPERTPEGQRQFERRIAVGLNVCTIQFITDGDIRALRVLAWEKGQGTLTDLELRRIDGIIRAREARKG